MVGQIGGRTEGEEEEEEVSEDVRPEDTRAGRRVLSIEYRGSAAFEVAIRTQRETGDREICCGINMTPANYPVSGFPLGFVSVLR